MDQGLQELGPLVSRELDYRDRGNDLGGGLAGLGVVGLERLERQLLYACLGLLVCLLEPFCLELRCSREFAGRKRVLESNTSSGSNVALSGVIRQLLDEGKEVL